MFFTKSTNTSKKASNGKTLPKAIVVEMYITKEGHIKYYGIKVGDKMGSDRTGGPVCSSNYKYVRGLAWEYNRRLNG